MSKMSRLISTRVWRTPMLLLSTQMTLCWGPTKSLGISHQCGVIPIIHELVGFLIYKPEFQQLFPDILGQDCSQNTVEGYPTLS